MQDRYLLLVINLIINLIFLAYNSFISILKVILHALFDINMNKTSKVRKRSDKDIINNQTIAKRDAIDANWLKFLSYPKLMNDSNDLIEKIDKQNSFTGTFRRDRKKKKHIEMPSTSVPKQLQSHTNDSRNIHRENLSINLSNNEDNNNDSKPGYNNSESKKINLTKFIAIDCEMVGIGYEGRDHMLARVSLVNKFGDCIYDKFVKPREEVIDYRTPVSGIRKEDLINAEDFAVVQKEVAEILKGRVLVGHSVKNDLNVLFLSHPKINIRDTSKYKPFRKITKGSIPSLKCLAKEVLGITIQSGEHSSVVDARAAMQLYCTVAKNWEQIMSGKRR